MAWLIRFVQQIGIAFCGVAALVLLYLQREDYSINTMFQLIPLLVIACGLYVLSLRRKEIEDQERGVSEETVHAIRVGAGTVIRLCEFRTQQLLYGKVFVQPHEVRVRISETHEVRCLVDTLQVSNFCITDTLSIDPLSEREGKEAVRLLQEAIEQLSG